ncbi:fumarylacetoacetate hydrolase family protein [Nocardia sp. NPDC005366]|uniref:fumarylacetoacetate hydrolase family protein n=1 Tax=Nocardia sp. NPDC005366 TaxID=3156878 RepID=UPI00339EDCA1
MQFATIRLGGSTRAAVVSGDHVHPFPDRTTVLDLVRSGLPAALAAGRHILADAPPVPVSAVTFDASLRPPTIRDFVTFEEHVEGVRAAVQGQTGVPEAWYAAPHFYFTNPHTVNGPDAVVSAPPGCGELDFELEVAAVVGIAGRDLSVEQAADHLFGYTILNDWSARDLQRLEMEVGLGPAKGKDFANTLGPVLVTADELAPRLDSEGFLSLSCTAHINGVETGRDMLSNMGWTFPTMLAYASRGAAIEPGDVLGSGTVGNGGCLAELWGRRGRFDPPPLRAGDVVALTVEGIGTLTNTVGTPAPPAAALPVPRLRDRAAHRAQFTAAAR